MSDIVDLMEYKARHAGHLVVSSTPLSVPIVQVTIPCNSLRHGMAVLDDWLASGVQIVCPRVAFEVVAAEQRPVAPSRAVRSVGVEFSDVVPTTGFFEGFANFLLLPFRWIWE